MLREIYFAMEEKYYKFLDMLDSKGIPVYKVVDPIDKVIPSFVLVLIVSAVLLVLIILMLSTSFGIFPQPHNIIISLTDKSNMPIANQLLNITYNNQTIQKTTNRAGAVTFEVAPNTTILVKGTWKNKEINRTIQITEAYQYAIKTEFNTTTSKILFRLQTSDGSTLSPVNLSFACTNPSAIAPQEKIRFISYDVELDIDPDCGDLLTSVNSDSYVRESSIPVYDGAVLTLNTLDQSGNGALVIRVIDSTNQPITNSQIDILLSSGFPYKTIQSATGYELLTGLGNGNYRISVTKEGYLGDAQTVSFTGEREQKEVIVTLRNSLNSSIKVRALDKLNNSLAIFDARVCLYQDGNALPYLCSNTNNEGYTQGMTVQSNTSNYRMSISKQGYAVYNQLNVNAGNSPIIAYMDRATNVARGCLKIKVLDADNSSVSNASVYIYDDKENMALQENRLTDYNGLTGCFTMQSGTYKAYAYKSGFAGTSNVFDYTAVANTTDASAVVTITIPKTALKLVVQDKFGNPISNAVVKIYDSFSSEVIMEGARLTSTNGELLKSGLRADKRYYYVVEKEGFETHVSISRFLPADTENVDVVIMERLSLDRKPMMSVEGVFNQDDKLVKLISAGNLYKIRFKLLLPQNEDVDYKKLYAVFVAGSEDIVEKEFFYIEKVESSALTSIIKGQAYLPNDEEETRKAVRQNTNEVRQGLAFEDQTKWTQLTWDLSNLKISNGIFYTDVYFRAKDNIPESYTINMFYSMGLDTRSNNANEEILYPVDNRDKTPADITTNKNYFTTFVGKGQQVCDELFCIQTTIFDKKNELITDVVTDSAYTSIIGNEYLFSFSLASNNRVPLNNYRLEIENPQKATFFSDYTITNVNSVNDNINSSTLNSYEKNYKITHRGTQMLQINNVIKGEINFTPNLLGTSTIRFRVVEDNKQIYEKEYFINVAASKDMNVIITPTLIPSYTYVALNVDVSDATTGELLKDVKVMLEDIRQNKVAEQYTALNGRAILDVPAQNPNLKLKLKVYKDEYKPYTTEFITSSNFIVLNPTELGIVIKKNEGRGKSDLVIENNSSIAVDLDTITFSGLLDEYVDTRVVNNYLRDAFKGKTLEANSKMVMPIVLGLTNIADRLTANTEYVAKLELRFKRRDAEGFWNFNVPLNITINMGDGLDTMDCLDVDTRTGKLLSANARQIHDVLTITNGCTVNGKPVMIQNIDAIAKWKGNSLGSITFGKDDRETKLQSAYYKTLAINMPQDYEETYTVNIVPKTGNIVGNSDVEIEFRASYLADSGLQMITAKTTYNVDVISTGDCFSFELPDAETDLIKTLRTEEANFKVKNNCDNLFDVKFFIMPDDFVEISPIDFTLQAKGEQVIKVRPKDSPVGVYLLDMSAKVPQSTYQAIRTGNDAFRVFVAPLPTDCLVLDNYEFDLYDTQSSPTDATKKFGYLINNCYKTDVQTTYPLTLTTGSVVDILGDTVAGGLTSTIINAIGGGLAGDAVEKSETPAPS